MTERYTGKLHHLREQARTRWGEVREQGGAREAVTKQVIIQSLESDLELELN